LDQAFNRVRLVLQFFLLAPGGLFAQEGTLRGRVIDQTTRRPIAAAGIFVEEINRRVVTDAEGIYLFLGIPAGVYSLHVAAIGYADLLRTGVRIHADFATIQNFALNAEDTAARDSSQLSTASPFRQTRLPHTVHFISQEEIQRSPVRGLQNLLDLQAGVVRQDGALHVRGGRSGQVAYFIDGITATNPFLTPPVSPSFRKRLRRFNFTPALTPLNLAARTPLWCAQSCEPAVRTFKPTLIFGPTTLPNPANNFSERLRLDTAMALSPSTARRRFFRNSYFSWPASTTMCANATPFFSSHFGLIA
jgi:hypothetical protein